MLLHGAQMISGEQGVGRRVKKGLDWFVAGIS